MIERCTSIAIGRFGVLSEAVLYMVWKGAHNDDRIWSPD